MEMRRLLLILLLCSGFVKASEVENLYSKGLFSLALSKIEKSLPNETNEKVIQKYLTIAEEILLNNEKIGLEKLRELYQMIPSSYTEIYLVDIKSSAINLYLTESEDKYYEHGVRYYSEAIKRTQINISIIASTYFKMSYLFLNGVCKNLEEEKKANCYYYKLFAKGHSAPYSNMEEVKQFLSLFPNDERAEEVMEYKKELQRILKQD